MDRDFADDLNLNYLAGIANLSVAHLTRLFVRHYGETPHAYLTRRRIEHATQLLRTTQLRIADIAAATGWTSIGTFSRTFKRLVGLTPTEYRRDAKSAAVPSCVARAWNRPRFTHDDSGEDSPIHAP